MWLNHNCGKALNDLYGDDGEMQCHKCGSDFKRQSLYCLADNIDHQHPGNFFKEKEEIFDKIEETLYMDSDDEN